MKITAIKYWQVDLPLREGRYSWSNGNFVEVFDPAARRASTRSTVYVPLLAFAWSFSRYLRFERSADAVRPSAVRRC